MGRIGSRGEHLREPLLEHALEQGGRKVGWRNVSPSPWAPKRSFLSRIGGGDSVPQDQHSPQVMFSTICYRDGAFLVALNLLPTWAEVLDAQGLLPFRGRGPEVETERLTSLCPSPAAATSHPHPHLPLTLRPTAAPLRIQEIPETTACDASSPRSLASGDLASSRWPWDSEGCRGPRRERGSSGPLSASSPYP